MKHPQLSQMRTYPCFTFNMISISNVDLTFRFIYLLHTKLIFCFHHTLWSFLLRPMSLNTFHYNLVSSFKRCTPDGLVLAHTVSYLLFYISRILLIDFYFSMNLFCLQTLLLGIRAFSFEDHLEFEIVSLILVGCTNFGYLRRVAVLRLLLIQMIISLC